MGLGTENKGIYLNTYKGKIVRKVDSKTEGAHERINKNGDVVHELQYDFVEGLLIDIKMREHEKYGRSWQFVFDDNGVIFNLNVPLSGGYAYGFYKRLPNIDFTRSMKLKGYSFDDDGTIKSGFTVEQGGTKVDLYYSKETPHDMPDLEEVYDEKMGKNTWSDKKRLRFFLEQMSKKYIPLIREQANSFEALAGGKEESKEEGLEFKEPDHNEPDENAQVGDEFDDLPF